MRFINSRKTWIGAFAAFALAIGGGFPAIAAPAPSTATGVSTKSVEGSITVTWKKATGANAPSFYQVKAVSSKGKTYYPCPKASARKNGRTQDSFTCSFTGRDGDASYQVSVLSWNGGTFSATKAVKVTPIATKTLTLTGKITGDLTKAGVSAKCPSWNLKGAKGVNLPKECQLQVLAVTANGLVFSSDNKVAPPVASTKSFTIKIRAVNTSRASVTLQLARADGSYLGPVLFTAAGKNTLNGQSFVGKTSNPADKTIALGTFKLNTRNNSTAFMTAAVSPAAANLRPNVSLMTKGVGSNVKLVPVGAGKAGFVQTAKIGKSSWEKVLNYPVEANLPVPKNNIFSTPMGTAMVRTKVSIGADGFAKITRADVSSVDCSTFFDVGATSALSDCIEPLNVYFLAVGIETALVDGFKTACNSFANDPDANLSKILSLPTDDTCRSSLVSIQDKLQNAGQQQGNGNNGQQVDCSQFANNAGLTLRDCYDFLLQQLSQQNPTLVFAFSTACGPYGTKDASNNPIDPVKYALNTNFQTLVTSKTNLCGLFFRINMDASGNSSQQIQIPKDCKTSFGAINDPTGFLSQTCYNQLGLISSIAATSDIPNICPSTLVNLPKSQWGDPINGIGYSGAYNCLMLLQKMGAGATNYVAPNCSANAAGVDGDSDGIPNALDVDDDGDLVIDTADSSGGVQNCNIEPSKSVRTTIVNPLNYGLIDAGAKSFDSDKSSPTYGMLVGEGEFNVGDLNAAINYALSGTNFSIAYYVYKSDFFPGALLDRDGSLPAVWVTCPGVIWCDSSTSRASIGTGMGMKNAKFNLSAASLSAGSKTITYAGNNTLRQGDQVSISGFNPGNVEFNFVNANVVSATSTSFTIAAPEKYCTYQSDQSNEIYSKDATCPQSTWTRTPNYGQDSTMQSDRAQAVIANPNWATGFNKTAFNWEVNAPWSSKVNGNSSTWGDASNKCAAPLEAEYQAALAATTAAEQEAAQHQWGDPQWYAAQKRAEDARRLMNLIKMSRSFHSPCWSELKAPVVFEGTSNPNGQCDAIHYNPNKTLEAGLPAQANYLWQSRCIVPESVAANGMVMNRIVQGGFISPNINMLEVNTNSNPADDIAAKDALSATDVLTLNYLAGDGTVASVATTIGAYPITAPLIRTFNGETVDYSMTGGAKGADRPIGSTGSMNCTFSETSDCLPNAVVIDPGTDGKDKLSITFDRPQREAFPGETSSDGYHDVYGLSYGLEMDAGGHLGCGNNFAAGRGGEMPIGASAYSDFEDQFTSNVSTDTGAAYLAPLKDKVVDTGAPAASDSVRLALTVDIVKCLRDRATWLAGKGVNLRNLQLPYGARTDGLASGWVPIGSGNGDPNCVQIMLNARGEGKTGGTDAAGQQFCLQFAPGALTDWSVVDGKMAFTPETVHGGNYLTPTIMNIQSTMNNGSVGATGMIGNFNVFSTSCQWDTWLIDESDNNARIETALDETGHFSVSGLVSGHRYSAYATASGCAPRDLESTSDSNESKFTAGQNGNGGGGCQENCGGGCQMNCGGGGGPQGPTWGNTWALGSNGWRTYLYGYDGANYNFTFQLIDNSNMQFVPGALMSEPTPELINGAPSGQLFIEVTGIDLTKVGSYRLRMIYHPNSDPNNVTTTDTAFIVTPFEGCFVSSTNLSPCPPPN